MFLRRGLFLKTSFGKIGLFYAIIYINNIIELKYMAHEIEADFRENWDDEKTQCKNCTSFYQENGKFFCSEAQNETPFDAHCDFFQSID